MRSSSSAADRVPTTPPGLFPIDATGDFGPQTLCAHPTSKPCTDAYINRVQSHNYILRPLPLS